MRSVRYLGITFGAVKDGSLTISIFGFLLFFFCSHVELVDTDAVAFALEEAGSCDFDEARVFAINSVPTSVADDRTVFSKKDTVLADANCCSERRYRGIAHRH